MEAEMIAVQIRAVPRASIAPATRVTSKTVFHSQKCNGVAMCPAGVRNRTAARDARCDQPTGWFVYC